MKSYLSQKSDITGTSTYTLLSVSINVSLTLLAGLLHG